MHCFEHIKTKPAMDATHIVLHTTFILMEGLKNSVCFSKPKPCLHNDRNTHYFQMTKCTLNT